MREEGKSKMVSNNIRPKTKTTFNKKYFEERFFICVMLVTAVVNFLIFWVYLNFSSILLAFQSIDVKGKTHWTLYNFHMIFSELTGA